MSSFLKKHTVPFGIGAFGYGLIEIIWRGFTHPSMMLAGGLSVIVLSAINKSFRGLRLLYRCIIGSAAITVIEFIFGCIFNLALKKGVWDYSSVKFNVLGQVCLLYSVLWGFLCIIALPLSEKLCSTKRNSSTG